MQAITFKNTLVIMIVLCSFRLNAADTLSLNEAITKKKVSAIINGVDPTKGTNLLHFGECIKIKLNCLGDKPYVIAVNTGTTFKCKDASISAMVCTKIKYISIVPKKELTQKIMAIATEFNKLTPSGLHVFTAGEICATPLLRVVKEVENGNYQNDIGQNAVWCATDNLPLQGLLDLCKDKVKSSALIKSVCKAQLIPVPKAYANAKVSQRVYFDYTLTDTSNVKIILYDNGGNVVLYFLTAKDKPKGDYKESYWISDADLDFGDYQALLYVNGVPLVTENIKF